MDEHEITAILNDDVTQALIDRSPVMRVAYTGRDGAPCVVPVAFLVRGTATTEHVDGVAPEYLEASFRTVPAEQHAEFEQGVRSLYDSMVRITVAPTFVRLNDFQRTAPQGVERLVAAKQS